MEPENSYNKAQVCFSLWQPDIFNAFFDEIEADFGHFNCCQYKQNEIKNEWALHNGGEDDVDFIPAHNQLNCS